MEIKTICTGTDPNICNAVIFGPGCVPVCEITGKKCKEYHSPTCDIKEQISQMFQELREGE